MRIQNPGVSPTLDLPAVSPFRGFSVPDQEVYPDVLHIAVVERSVYLVNRFLESHHSILGQSCVGFREAVDSWIKSGAPDFDAVWDVSFGVLWDVVRSDPDTTLPGTVERIAADLALRLAALRWPLKLTIRLSGPTCLRFSRWIFPRTCEMSLECTGKDAILTIVDSDRRHWIHYFTFGNSMWMNESRTHVQSIRVGLDSWIVVPSQCLRFPEYYGNHTHYDEMPVEFPSRTEEALEIIGTCIPQYLGWIRRVVRSVAVLRQIKPGDIFGGSRRNTPGLIHVTNSGNCFDIADTLIHESAHQYFNILSNFGETADKGQGEKYFSPFVREFRDLSRILMTYHAFGNALLFYSSAIDFGLGERAELTRIGGMIKRNLNLLEGYIQSGECLSELGMEIYLPLRSKLSAVSLEE